MLHRRKRIVQRLALGASVLVILVTLSTFVAVADDCGKDADLWFPAPGTHLTDGHTAVQTVTAPESQGGNVIVCQGEILSITITVDNLTCGGAGPFDVSLYYDQFDGAHLIGTQRVGAGLEACEYVTLDFTWDTAGVSPGEHTIIAWADVHNEVDEIHEDDNQYTLRVVVTVRPFAPLLEADKTYVDENGGSPMPGDTITYETEITNDGCEELANNPTHEFTDDIPGYMTYVSGTAAADSGTVSFDGNRVVWDGTLLPGETVTITFKTVIAEDTPDQTTICNQGHIHWDSDSNGDNDADEPTNDPSIPIDDDPTCLTVFRPTPVLSAEKTFSTENGGSPATGDVVTYTILIRNTGDAAQEDNPGHEFTDDIPNHMSYVAGSVSASSGTVSSDEDQIVWDGAIPSGGTVTITFQTRVAADTPEQTTICNQGVIHWDSNGDGNNDSQETTDNPATPVDDDPTCVTVVKHLPAIDAEKEFTDEDGGSVSPEDIITYSIRIYNRGEGVQEDNPEHEFIDPIPGFMEYVPGSVSSSSGTAVADGDEVLWDGEIAPGEFITITFQAKINKDIQDGQEICNQGHVHWDSNADGTNDADEPSDDPATAIDDDPTCLTVTISDEPAMVGTIDAPTLSQWAQITMSILLLLSFAVMLLKRRDEAG